MFPTDKITGRQLTAARSLLGITQSALAEAADVTEQTILLIESSKVTPRRSTMEKVRSVLEARGIEFTNGDGIGVRLRYNTDSDTKPAD